MVNESMEKCSFDLERRHCKICGRGIFNRSRSDTSMCRKCEEILPLDLYPCRQV